MKKVRTLVKITVMLCLSTYLLQGFDGVGFGLVYTGESISIINGNTDGDKIHYLDNLDFQVEFDFESLGLWSGGSAFIYLLSNTGADISTFVGDAQVTSNIEANNSRRLYELWYNQVLANGRIEVLVGLHDLNSEFYTNDCAGLFNNSSFGIGADVAANAPVGIFNLAALGARVSFSPSKKVTFKGAVYDGDPGDPEVDKSGLKVDWNSDQGLMTIMEAQYFPNIEGERNEGNTCNAYRLGAWYHSGEFEKVQSDELVFVRGNYGMYFSVEQTMTQHFSGFVHGGFAANDRSAVPYYYGLGLNTHQLLASRPEDVFGLAIASAKIIEEDAWEIAVEGTWHIQITEWFSLKPDVQYVIHPSGIIGHENVLQFGVRTEVGF